MVIHTTGGLGLFLLGMVVMTDALRMLAGDVMRASLMRFTSSPLSGAITGTVSTAILQSSSATTVAAIGFVSAGLITFPEALGIVLGANIGTTVTGWLIALLGFKLKLGALALPIVLFGVLLRLFARQKLAGFGFAIAGFGLIFIGITEMQEGMAGVKGIISPENIGADSWAMRLKLVALGIIATIITQSSSAGVAATLTALYAGAIEFPQAAALVIGMDVGTTVTAVMATIGGSVGARRTGFSHVLYNLLTGTGALILITPYMWLWNLAAPGQLDQNAEIAVVAFHTLFNIMGVLTVLPFAQQFAHLVERIIPEQVSVYTRRLDKMLLQQPVLALSAIHATIHTEFTVILAHISALLGDIKTGNLHKLHELQNALEETEVYLDQIHMAAVDDGNWERLVALIHTLDHMQRLHNRCEEMTRAMSVRYSPELQEQRCLLIETINRIIDDIDHKRWVEACKVAHDTKNSIHKQVKPYREKVISKIGSGKMKLPEGTESTEAIRWLRRVSRHIERMTYYLGQSYVATGK